MNIHELRYSNTNTYLIEGSRGMLLFDTGWAGTFPAFCQCMGKIGIPVQKIDAILISHFHPDHMGIAQEIADLGAVIAVPEVQREFIHVPDSVFEKEKNRFFRPVKDEKTRFFPLEESRAFLDELGIGGEILHTPGHSDDSISLFLDDGSVFVGDLNPLYELELHKGTQIGESWGNILEKDPVRIYYGHAKPAEWTPGTGSAVHSEKWPTDPVPGVHSAQVSRIMKLIDKGYPLDKIQKKTGADRTFIEDVTRMYLTHPNVGVQGILDRIEIKGR